MVTVENNNGTIENVIGMVPDMVSKVGAIFKKDKPAKEDFADIKLDDPEI